MDQTPMTPRGEELLRQELVRLKTVERPRIVAAIAEARSHGDLSENAEYDAAKEEQGMCEARIKDIEGKIATATGVVITKPAYILDIRIVLVFMGSDLRILIFFPSKLITALVIDVI